MYYWWFFVFLHMIARTTLISFLLLCYSAIAQEVSLPADLRQHTLTQYNASLFNPTFSLDRNNPQSISFWTRWQWQQIDADPTTLFLNYSRRIDDKSGFGAGFFQHNTGIYFNTGGVVNYAYEIKLNPIIKLSVGANLFGFQQQLADTRFIPNPDDAIIPIDFSDDFILQLAPGFNLSVENFSLSMASENLFDYNVTDKGANTETSDKIFMGMASYDFPVMSSDSTAFLRPSIYLRTLPEQENQIGLNTLFSTQKYWAQAGYNNFYGISVGAGGTIFNRVSVGALVEFGTSASLNSKDASFEIIASYFLGNPSNRRKPIVNVFDALEDDVAFLNEEEKADKMKEELENAQKVGSEETTEEEALDEKTVEQEEESFDETTDEKEEESTVIEEPKIDKKEAKKLAAQEKALVKERRKDSLDQLKIEKEALVLKEKADKENAKLAEEEARLVELTSQKKKEKEALAAAEETKRIEALNEQEKAKEAAAAIKKAQAMAEAERVKLTKQKDSLVQAKKMDAIAAAERMKAKQKADAVEKAKAAEILAAAEKLSIQKQQDSINKIKEELLVSQKTEEAKVAEESINVIEVEETEEEEAKEEVKEVVKVQAGEKYEEVITEEGLEPGYYLIANVFGTKKYFDAFMEDLKKKGMYPGSFVRSKNNYNYVYLERYNTISHARSARDNRFGGKYQAKTWIFRVVGK